MHTHTHTTLLVYGCNDLCVVVTWIVTTQGWHLTYHEPMTQLQTGIIIIMYAHAHIQWCGLSFMTDVHSVTSCQHSQGKTVRYRDRCDMCLSILCMYALNFHSQSEGHYGLEERVDQAYDCSTNIGPRWKCCRYTKDIHLYSSWIPNYTSKVYHNVGGSGAAHPGIDFE